MSARTEIFSEVLRRGGFTLIELLVTLSVAAILMSLAVPALQDLIAGQRVRAAASELVGDLSLARVYAISNGRRVAVAPLDQANDDWADGWRVLVCADRTAASNCPNVGVFVACTGEPAGDPGCAEELKHHQALSGHIKVCTRKNPAAAVVATPAIVFGPDGRVSADTPGVALAINAFMVSDDMGDAVSANDKMRALEFATAGRISLYQVNSAQGGVACP